MVYGHDNRIRDETWPVTDHFYAKFRRGIEQAIIKSPNIYGIVIRPAWVFGGTGGPWGNRCFSNPEKLVLRGVHKDRKYSWIHIEDLAEAYVLAGIKANTVKGYIFNISNTYDTPAFADLLLQGNRLAGYKGEVHWEDNKAWQDELLDATVIVDSRLATNLLGFVPKNIGFLDNLEFYYKTYLAKNQLYFPK